MPSSIEWSVDEVASVFSWKNYDGLSYQDIKENLHKTFRKDVSIGSIRIIYEKFNSFQSAITGMIDWDQIPDEYISVTQSYLIEKAFPKHIRPILNDMASLLANGENIHNLLNAADQ